MSSFTVALCLYDSGLTWGRSVYIQVETIFRLVLEQGQGSLDVGSSPGWQSHCGVVDVRQVLGTHGSVVISQESLLPGGHCHRRHEPQATKGRGCKGDAEEGGHGLEIISRLMHHTLYWSILGVHRPEHKYVWFVMNNICSDLRDVSPRVVSRIMMTPLIICTWYAGIIISLVKTSSHWSQSTKYFTSNNIFSSGCQVSSSRIFFLQQQYCKSSRITIAHCFMKCE